MCTWKGEKNYQGAVVKYRGGGGGGGGGQNMEKSWVRNCVQIGRDIKEMQIKYSMLKCLLQAVANILNIAP